MPSLGPVKVAFMPPIALHQDAPVHKKLNDPLFSDPMN